VWVRIVIPDAHDERRPASVSRRRFLVTSAAVGAAGMGIAGCAFGPNASAVEATRHVLPVPGLPDSLDGLRIAHVTDTHFPANRAAGARALAIIAAERPDVVVYTGDMVEHARALDDLVAFARDARGTRATVAVRGNWELSAGISRETLAAAYASAGVTYLQNDCASVRIGSSTLALAGLDDPVLGHPDARHLADRAEGDAVIWALHGPGYADLLPRDTPAHLLLAGHTHGGQIRLPFLPGLAPSGSGRFMAGWYRTAAAPLYVSRGVGTTTIRARLFCPPELPIITLTRALAPVG
jgi:predicted MPP superfamily phosphohydrolase